MEDWDREDLCWFSDWDREDFCGEDWDREDLCWFSDWGRDDFCNGFLGKDGEEAGEGWMQGDVGLREAEPS